MATEERLKNLKEIFSKRLQNARKMCGLSQAELSNRTQELEKEDDILYKGVSSTAIERYENGVMFPESDGIMIALAKVLNTNETNLLRPFGVQIDFSRFEFRKKAKLGKKAVEAIKLKIQERVEKYVEIERIAGIEPMFEVDLSDILVSGFETARQAAMKLRELWQLGVGPIPQPILVLESHGVKVIEVEEDVELFDGTSNMIEGIPVLVLNKKENEDTESKFQNNEERRRLTLFHELAHMILKFADALTDKEKENLCNSFACEMLIPSQTFIEIFGEKRQMISSWELKDVQREYGISVQALMRKAKELGVITDNRYKWFCITLGKKENEKFRKYIDKCETPVQHTSRYDRIVYRALGSEIITTSKAAEMLNISVSELRNNLNFEIANGYNN